MLLRRAALLVLTLAALPAGAETYKWLDERGVVNYSNHPPPVATAGSKLARVEDRVSTYPSDPAVLRAAAAPRPDYAEIEWLQRQRIMAEQQAAGAAPKCDDRTDCRPEYLPAYYPFIPVGFAHRRAVVRPTFFISQPARARGSAMFR